MEEDLAALTAIVKQQVYMSTGVHRQPVVHPGCRGPHGADGPASPALEHRARGRRRRALLQLRVGLEGRLLLLYMETESEFSVSPEL
jgi:hypothetical protein